LPLTDLLAQEVGTVRKKWRDRLPIALLYPAPYSLAVSNLGWQLLYHRLNSFESVVCERFVYPEADQLFRSLESSRPLSDFSLVFASISFEQDYPALAAMLVAGGIEPFAEKREGRIVPGNPLVVLGGVAVFMNPEPLAPFADLMVIGEAEPVLPGLVSRLAELTDNCDRTRLVHEFASGMAGCYAPSLYRCRYDSLGRLQGWKRQPGLPEQVRRIALKAPEGVASHSTILSPQAELGMFMVELGRGCSRGCRFCAAGFIYRPPRLWSADAVISALEKRPSFCRHIGLLGMEMSGAATLDRLAGYLRQQGCSLSFSSLRADRITDDLLALLESSGLKSVAIAPDGCSQRLRMVINKGLATEDILRAAGDLARTGIHTLKLYVMIGLPTETREDLDEFIALVGSLHQELLAVGRRRGRICQMMLSVNSFVPKPWTPFQYVGFGGGLPCGAGAAEETDPLPALRKKLRYLKQGLRSIANIQLRSERPERALQQAVFSRADRRIAPVLLDIGTGKRSFKQAMKYHGLSPWQYGIRSRSREELFCWDIIDHGLKKEYLWRELEKALAGRETVACDTAVCRRCGVCNAAEFS